MLLRDLSEEPLPSAAVIPRKIPQNKKIIALLDLVYLKLALINSKNQPSLMA